MPFWGDTAGVIANTILERALVPPRLNQDAGALRGAHRSSTIVLKRGAGNGSNHLGGEPRALKSDSHHIPWFFSRLILLAGGYSDNEGTHGQTMHQSAVR